MAIDLGIYRAVVEIAVKATVLLGAAGVMTMLLRRGRAASRHAWWTAAMVGISLLPVLTLVLPVTSVAPAVSTAPRGLSAAVIAPEIARPASSSLAVARPSAPIDNLSTDTISAASTPTIMAEGDPATPTAPAAAMTIDWPLIGLSIYLAGLMLFGLPVLLAPWRMHRRLKRIPAAALENAAVERAHAALGMRHRLPVLLTDALAMPVAVGLYRPVILLPHAAALWSNERLEAVLLHELAHIARRDLLTQALALLARAVYWPHPLAWIALRQMETEREKACDDLVIGRGVDAPSYAQTLLEMAMHYQRRPLMRYSTVSMARPSSLENRIRAVLRPEARRGAISRTALLTLATASLAMTAGLATLTAAPPPPSTQPSQAEIDKQIDDALHSAQLHIDVDELQRQSDATQRGEHPPATAPATNHAALPAGTVSIIAVGRGPSGPFWTVDGQPTLLPSGLSPDGTQPNSRVCVLKVRGGDEDASPPIVLLRQGRDTRNVETLNVRPSAAADHDAYYAFSYQTHSKLPVDVGLARGPWKTFAEGNHAATGKAAGGTYVIGDPTESAAPGMGAASATKPTVEVQIAFTLQDCDTRAVAVFADGSEHPMITQSVDKEGSLSQMRAYLEDATLATITTFRFQSRPIEWTTFDHIATEPVSDGAAAASPADEPAGAAARLSALEEQLKAMDTRLDDVKKSGQADQVSALAAERQKLELEMLQLQRNVRQGAEASTPSATVDDLSTQDLVGQIKKLQDEMATLATVPHGPYVAGPNGPETPGLTKHVQEMRAEIERLNAELAKRAGG